MKQHYVPKVYLKRFALNSHGHIYACKFGSKFDTYPKLLNVSSICYVKDLYTVDKADSFFLKNIEDKYHIEKNAFPYEKKDLKILFDKLEKEKPILKSEGKEILKIMLSIKRRNPMAKQFYSKKNTRPILNKTLTGLRNEMNDLYQQHGHSVFLEVYDKAEQIIQEKFEEGNILDDLYKSSILDFERLTFPNDQILL